MIHVVLYEPEIPQNTGNIMRTCVVSGCHLHLIEPLGFILDDKKVRRSVMDYAEQLELVRHVDWESFLAQAKGHIFYLSRYGQKAHSSPDYSLLEEDIYLVFGSESQGIPKAILRENTDHCFRIPMIKTARSMNLSNAVAIAVYEVLRQKGYENLTDSEFIKGKGFIHDQ